MPRAEGWPVWYELMTSDPAKVAPFYKAVIGWTIPADGMTMANGANYRFLERADGGHEGGVLAFNEGMIAAGMHPIWAAYFCSSDVDATVARAKSGGAAVHMEPTDLPGAGRIAMLADPQGAMFYLIDPTPPEGQEEMESDVFTSDIPGRCAWNELNTDNAPGQLEFYSSLFDWTVGGEMPMPGDHTYQFLDCNGTGIGAIGSMKPDGMPNMWLPYFRVEDIDTSGAAVTANGGKIVMGPHEVPGGDTIIVTLDPDGAAVGFVGRKGS